MFDAFYDVEEKMKKGNPYAKKVMDSWANAEWFTSRPEVPEKARMRHTLAWSWFAPPGWTCGGCAWACLLVHTVYCIHH